VSTSRAKLLALLDLGLVAAMLALVVASNPTIGGDAIERYAALTEWWSKGRANATKSSLVGPLLASPIYWLGGKLGERDQLVAYFNLFVFAIAITWLFIVLRRAIGPQLSGRFIVLVAFASGFPHELHNFNNEVLSSLAIGAGLLALSSLTRWRTTKWLGGLAIVIGTVNMAANAIGSTLALARLIAHTKRLRFMLVVAACALGLCAEAWIRRGSPFVTGYEGNHGNRTALPYSGLPGFSYPFLLGVGSIVFSFGKGLLFFYPGLVVPAQRFIDDDELKVVHQAWLLVVVGLIVVYARWWAWYGGMCWGPRFFLFAALPSGLALAYWAERARSTSSAIGAVLVIALAFWVGYDGLVFEIQQLDICGMHNNKLEAFCWYLPEFSPLIRPFIVTRELAPWECWAVALFSAAYLRVTAATWRNIFVFGREALGLGAQQGRRWLRELRF
jgi:hypothetical protein